MNHPFLFSSTYEEPVDEIIGSSGKFAVLDKLLLELYDKKHRCVIFSQFTQVLNLIEDYCYQRGWHYARLDGSVSRARRTYLIDRFNDVGSEDFIFLMSTRAGGMGINLQVRDRARECASKEMGVR